MTMLLKPDWVVWHRWLGLITCVAILLWGVSGLSHPIMSRLQPNSAVFSAPAASFDLSTALTPGAVLKQNSIARLQRLSVIRFDKQSYYRVTTTTDQPARYFATDSGHELLDGDRRYAEFLACYYSGLKPSQITDSRLVTIYSDDYHAVNQLLPVWRVAFAGD